MIKADENALICDLAETYSIYNYKQIAASQVAIFAIGLRDNSRIKMSMNGQKLDTKTILLAKLVDSMNLLLWSKTADARKGNNRPISLLESVFGDQKEISVFKSGKDFEVQRKKILAGRRV